MKHITVPNIIVKSNAHYTCRECGSTEMLQAHHQIPKDDSTLICLCAECRSKKHPDIPHGLFINKSTQPYWNNKSASSLARSLGVCSRTVVRTARKLGIMGGLLTQMDEDLIQATVHPRCKSDFGGYYPANWLRRWGLLAGELGISKYRLSQLAETLGIEKGVLSRMSEDVIWCAVYARTKPVVTHIKPSRDCTRIGGIRVMKQQTKLKCPYCQSVYLRKRGSAFTSTGAHQRWECRSCKRLTIIPSKTARTTRSM